MGCDCLASKHGLCRRAWEQSWAEASREKEGKEPAGDVRACRADQEKGVGLGRSNRKGGQASRPGPALCLASGPAAAWVVGLLLRALSWAKI